MVRRALTRQTRWYQIRCSIFKIKDFIVEKPFWKILEFWPLETPILTWAKKWLKWIRNDFSRAFERCLSFFSTATRGWDHGGAFKRPPPSRRWKIQRPSRARVKTYRVLFPLVDALRSFWVSRGSHMRSPPPPGHAKVAQTPGRARVNKDTGLSSSFIQIWFDMLSYVCHYYLSQNQQQNDLIEHWTVNTHTHTFTSALTERHEVRSGSFQWWSLIISISHSIRRCWGLVGVISGIIIINCHWRRK